MEYTLEVIESKIKAIIATTLKIDASHFGPDTALIEELGADSLDALTIAMDVDDEFGINVDDKDLHHFKSCRDISAAVLRHLQNRVDSTNSLSA
ncbi:MAG: acyl carrier protein [Actinomycetota bacterium]